MNQADRSLQELKLQMNALANAIRLGQKQVYDIDDLCERYSKSEKEMKLILKAHGMISGKPGKRIKIHCKQVLILDDAEERQMRLEAPGV